MKKGFTLIELLGTIVILGMIALIATPPIVNLVKKSNQKISDNNIKLIYKAGLDYIDQFENDYELVKGKKICLSIQKIVDNGNLKESFIKQQKINTGNSIQFIVGDKMKLTYNLKLYDATCSKEVSGSEPSTPTPSATPTAPPKTYTVGQIVYFDPTGVVTDCKTGKEWTSANKNTTCYKWNVIKDNGNTVEMLVDHNTTESVAWSANNNNTLGPKEAYQTLISDTASWNKVETYTSADNITVSGGESTNYQIIYNGYKGRFLGGREVANIVSNKTWTPDGSEISLASASWLCQNLDRNKMIFGYWTDTANRSNNNFVWGPFADTQLFAYNKYVLSNYFGVRPVVRVLKSNLS